MQLTGNFAITQSDIDASLTYDQYRQLLDRLILEQKTTGNNHSESMLHYAKMNISRMKKWDKIFTVSDQAKKVVQSITEKQTWIVITEGWCGDAAQSVPVFVKMAAENPLIEIRFLLRDENLDIMDQYLTNGGRSIPKLIALKSYNLEEIFNWGPRPLPAQELFQDLKKQGLPYAEPLHIWYAKDKGKHVEQELSELLMSE